jgi:hypothetical protein
MSGIVAIFRAFCAAKLTVARFACSWTQSGAGAAPEHYQIAMTDC